MTGGQERCGLRLDPRTKILLLLLCVLSSALAPSLFYEMIVVCVVACYGIFCGKVRYSLTAVIVYAVVCFLTHAVFSLHGSLQVMLIAFLGLVHKVYPCGILSGIIISNTKVGEFLSAMNRSRVSKKIVIPVAVMLRYVPTIREDWQYSKDAMRMRDVAPGLKNFLLHPVMTIECIYVPLMMAASKTADELTVASITRGIENPVPRTSYARIGFGAADVAAAAVFLALFLAGRLCRGVFH
nr:energy-coupling factor transporter transmembrane component T [uncultured Eisenbergiella sp.]